MWEAAKKCYDVAEVIPILISQNYLKCAQHFNDNTQHYTIITSKQHYESE